MVNFGGHLREIKTEESKKEDGQGLFVVPYNSIKELIFEENGDKTGPAKDTKERFEQTWMQALEDASRDFKTATQDCWQSVFEALPEPRGSPLGNALRLYLEHAGPESARNLLARLVRIHTVEITNSEALRKLVKKYDKRHAQDCMSVKLLPRLYASSVYTGQAMLEDSISMLRSLLNEEERTSQVFLPLDRKDSEAINKLMVESRGEELEWLHRLVASVPSEYIGRLVAHRGFHHVGDREDKRPLENSLAAYELAWTSGIHLCECDIALTKDEKLVLAHDSDFKRLALDSKSENSSKLVSELTFRELISLPLKSGVRPPLLIDVLRSAHAISENAKLVVEIKPGNAEAGAALARLLLRHTDLARCVAMVMSFDAVTMHRLHDELYAALAAKNMASRHGVSTVPSRLDLAGQLSMHRRYASFDHFGTFANGSPSPFNSTRHFSRPSEQDFIGLDLSPRDLGIGMSLSQMNLKVPDPPRDIGEVREAVMQESSFYLPKLMLLTVADPPKKPCEMRVRVEDLSPVDSWLKTNDGGSLDGVYLQFQQEMMTPDGASALNELSKRHTVGVWAHSGKDPDDFETFHWLVQKGNVTFVNTDLPGHFRRGVFKRSSNTPL